MLYFKRNIDDPVYNAGLGNRLQIEKWLSDYGISKNIYTITDDLTIDVYEDFVLVNKHLEQFPDFIKFNICYAGFYVGGNPWKSLIGFPKEIFGDLQLYSYSNPLTDNESYKKFTKKEIKKIIKVHGQIWS